MTQQIFLGSYADFDPYLSNVSLLLHSDGANASTTFIDNSPLALSPPTVFGNVQMSTSRVKFGPTSALFDGSGDALLYPHNAAHHLSGDFTIEGYLYALSSSSVRNLLNKGGGASIAWASYEVILDASGVLRFAASSTNTGYDIGAESGAPGTIGTPSLNAWHHFAITRQGNVYRTFLDGVPGWTSTLALTPYDASPRGLAIGGSFATTWGTGTPVSSHTGNLDDIRITNGVARYTAAFTPPSSPFPNS